MSSLPRNILATAFQLNSDYAWKKEDLEQVFSYCLQSSIAIVSVEAWVVRKVDDCDNNEPILPIHNLDPQRNQHLSVLGCTREHVIWGLFPLRNGKKVLFSWGASDQSDQSWQEYVHETVTEANRVINEGNIEEEIAPKHAPFVYYNLLFELENGESF